MTVYALPLQSPMKPRRLVWLLFEIFLAIGCLLATAASGQVPADTSSAERDVERLLEDQSDEVLNADYLAEKLADLAENPIDLNTATETELLSIPAINSHTAHRIVEFRKAGNGFDTTGDLIHVPGIDSVFLASIRPYVTVARENRRRSKTPFPRGRSLREMASRMHFAVIQRVTRRLDLGRGYDRTKANAYMGSPERLYMRIRGYYRKHISLNLTTEKDPGEDFRWDPSSSTYGYDFVSAHIALGEMGRLKRLIVGDFDASFGQGLILWSNFAIGKGREPVRPVVRSGDGLRPYASADENRFFRGIATTLMLAPGISLSGFASRHRLDASILKPDSLAMSGHPLAALSTSGLHRTPGEFSKKDQLRESVFGWNLAGRLGATHIGVAGYTAHFDPLIGMSTQPYRRFDFSGKRLSMISLYGSSTIRNLTFAGELAGRLGKSPAVISSLEADFEAGIEAVASIRSYPRDFDSPHGFAFGERNGESQSETGFYLGLRLTPGHHWKISGFFDQYRFPWIRFAVPRPTTGHEAFLSVEFRPRNWISVEVQGRTETRENGAVVSDEGGRLLDAVAPETRRSLRLQYEYSFSRSLRLRTRIETTQFRVQEGPSDHGLLIYQEIRWQAHPMIRVDARLAFFDSDSFNSRITTYEADLTYTFSAPSFSGQGQRSYILVNFVPSSSIQIQMKYASTRFENVQTVGSGLDEFEGNRIREIRVQFLVKF